jgi:hypothetical protein
MNTAISDRLIDRTVNPTSRAPISAALNGATPSSMCRDTFSRTTIASSTTKPVAIVSAIRERLLRLKPHRYMMPKVAIRETGTATLGMSVARQLRRKMNTTSTTRQTATISVRSTSRNDARIVVVRSITTSTLMALGIEARICGSISVTLSTVSMMFAFGCRLMMISTEGLPFDEPALRRSCTESTTRPRSVSLTAAPLR